MFIRTRHISCGADHGATDTALNIYGRLIQYLVHMDFIRNSRSGIRVRLSCLLFCPGDSLVILANGISKFPNRRMAPRVLDQRRACLNLSYTSPSCNGFEMNLVRKTMIVALIGENNISLKRQSSSRLSEQANGGGAAQQG